MKRRSFIKIIAGAAVAWPSTTRSQQQSIPVIGWLGSTPGLRPPLAAAFDAGLKETGYIAGQTVANEYRFAEFRYERLPALAADLVERKVTVIATFANVNAARAAKEATSTIPVIFLVGADPLESKLVTSLNRPGGNVTGITLFGATLTQKRLELLHELRPNTKTVAILQNPKNTDHASVLGLAPDPNGYRKNFDDLQRTLGVSFEYVGVGTVDDIEPTLAGLAQKQVDALHVAPDPFFLTHRERLATAAAHHAIATSFPDRESVVAGGLIGYGASIANGFRQVGNYVGRVLNGEKPADLPVLQPTKFDLVLNLKTAKALGIEVPNQVLIQATEMIE